MNRSGAVATVVGLTVLVAAAVALTTRRGHEHVIQIRKERVVHHPSPPPKKTVYLLRAVQLHPPIPLAAPLPVASKVRLQRGGRGGDVRLVVWLFDHDGRGLTRNPDAFRLWPAAQPTWEEDLASPSLLGRLTVVLDGTLNDTDVVITLLNVAGAETWRGTVRRGTQGLHEVTFGVPEEWQPLAHWDASRAPSVIGGPTGVKAWVPLRAAGPIGPVAVPTGPVDYVEAPHRALRLVPSTALAVNLAPPGVSGGTFLIALRSGPSGARTLLTVAAGAAPPLLGLSIEPNGALVVRVGAAEVVRHMHLGVAGLAVLACSYTGADLTTLCTGDLQPTRTTRTFTPPPAADGTAPLSVRLGGAKGGEEQRVVDVHEVLFFARPMEDTLLRAMHQHLSSKWWG